MPDPPPDPLLARLRDRLRVNDAYAGILADGYDAWIPVDEEAPHEPIFRRLLADAGGPVLELGCGTGRPMLRWLADGLAVEGLDASPDMVAILRRHAAERGLDPVVHVGDLTSFALGRTYGAVVCLVGTFLLVTDDDRARAALRCCREHLAPGGLLALTLFVPADDAEALGWRVRRTGTTPAGETVMVSEAVRLDRDARRHVAFDRIERIAPDGLVTETHIRRFELRLWERDEFAALLAETGFTAIDAIGDDTAWVAVAHRPH